MCLIIDNFKKKMTPQIYTAFKNKLIFSYPAILIFAKVVIFSFNEKKNASMS